MHRSLAVAALFRATAIAQLNEEVQDTLLALNSDLYYGLLDIYAFAKASNRDGRYDEVVATLKPFFSRPRKKGSPRPRRPIHNRHVLAKWLGNTGTRNW